MARHAPGGTVVWVTDCFLRRPHIIKLAQNPWLGSLQEPGEPVAIILLSGRSILLPSKCTSLPHSFQTSTEKSLCAAVSAGVQLVRAQRKGVSGLPVMDLQGVYTTRSVPKAQGPSQE